MSLLRKMTQGLLMGLLLGAPVAGIAGTAAAGIPGNMICNEMNAPDEYVDECRESITAASYKLTWIFWIALAAIATCWAARYEEV